SLFMRLLKEKLVIYKNKEVNKNIGLKGCTDIKKNLEREETPEPSSGYQNAEIYKRDRNFILDFNL
ncbi:MAG: hypothetical protein ABIG67_11495, partial [Pseudomonadota bacterium]